MTVTITLPDDLATRSRLRAAALQQPVEELALDLLRVALLAEPAPPALEEVVAQIRATVPNPTGPRAARSGLANTLAEEGDADFDVAAWQAAWLAAEAELAAIEHTDELAEGRRDQPSGRAGHIPGKHHPATGRPRRATWSASMPTSARR